MTVSPTHSANCQSGIQADAAIVNIHMEQQRRDTATDRELSPIPVEEYGGRKPMHYKFNRGLLTVHAGDLVGLMEEAQQATGGFFARLAPAQSRAAAEHEADRARQALLTVQLDIATVQQATRTRTTNGISLADARRLAQEIDTRLRAWAAGQYSRSAGTAGRIRTTGRVSALALSRERHGGADR